MAIFKLLFMAVLFMAAVSVGACTLIRVDVSMPVTQVRYQLFSGGVMLWRHDNAVIYVIANDGRTWELPANEYGMYAENVFSYDYSLYGKPIVFGGFGRVWANYDDIRLALGDPHSAEIDFVSHIHQMRRGTAFIELPDGRSVFTFNGRWFTANFTVDIQWGAY